MTKNEVGRNEFLFALKVDYPRNLGIYGHKPEDFTKLILEMDNRVITSLEKVRIEFNNIPGIISTNEYDSGIIADNFISYLCMIESEYLEQALKKYSHKLTDGFISQIELIRAAKNKNNFDLGVLALNETVLESANCSDISRH